MNDEQRLKLRESALRICDEYGIGKKRERKDKKKAKALAPVMTNNEFYDKITCKECGAPVEKTGRQGRPPTKCLKHR